MIPRLHVVIVAAAALSVLALVAVATTAVPFEGEVRSVLNLEGDTCEGDPRRSGSFGAWRRETDFPEGLLEARAVRLGGSIYIAGGFERYAPGRVRGKTTFVRYDVASRTYTALEPLPEPLNHIGIAAYGGAVYVVGGVRDYLEPFSPTNQVWRYRVASGRWEALAPMSTARGALAVAVVGDTLYALGGRGARNITLRSTEVYDLRRGTWREGPALRVPGEHLGAGELGGALHVAGGRGGDGGRAVRRFERLDPATSRWRTLPPLPEPTSGFGALARLGGRLAVVGGENPADGWVTGAVWAYSPASRSWAQLPSLPFARTGHAVAAGSGTVHVFGGSGCLGFSPNSDVVSLSVRRP